MYRFSRQGWCTHPSHFTFEVHQRLQVALIRNTGCMVELRGVGGSRSDPILRCALPGRLLRLEIAPAVEGIRICYLQPGSTRRFCARPLAVEYRRERRRRPHTALCCRRGFETDLCGSEAMKVNDRLEGAVDYLDFEVGDSIRI
jgi:hypothetical protein